MSHQAKPKTSLSLKSLGFRETGGCFQQRLTQSVRTGPLLQSATVQPAEDESVPRGPVE